MRLTKHQMDCILQAQHALGDLLATCSVAISSTAMKGENSKLALTRTAEVILIKAGVFVSKAQDLDNAFNVILR